MQLSLSEFVILLSCDNGGDNAAIDGPGFFF